MSDWEIVPNNSAIQQNQSSSDWETVPMSPNSQQPQSNENLGMAALKAVPRVTEDVYRGAMNTIKSIPHYYESAKTELPGIPNTLMHHPRSLIRQGLAGMAELGQNLFNTPHDIVNYATNRLNLIPENFNKKIQMGRMPDSSAHINQTFGAPQYPGEALTRGVARNLLGIAGIGKVSSLANPMKYTDKAIANNLVKTEKSMISKYSGPEGLYNKLSDEAKSRGLNLDHIDFDKIPMDSIDLPSLNTLAKEKNLKNAQTAISDLGFRERVLDRKNIMGTLDSEGKKRLKEARDAKSYIQENMFKDKKGKIHNDLLDKHKAIQKGYATEVIPYTKNAAIQAYKKDEKLPNELLSSVSKGKFAAKRGKFHPEIGRRKLVEKIIKNPLARGAGFTAGALGAGLPLYDLVGHKNEE